MEYFKVLIPNLPQKGKETLLKGYITQDDKCHSNIYFTESCELQHNLDEKISVDDDTTIFGYFSNEPSQLINKNIKNKICLYDSVNPRVTELVLNGKVIKDCKFIFICYDINKVVNSETLDISCKELMYVRELVDKKSNQPQNIAEYVPKFKIPNMFSSSMFIQHIFNCINLLNWLINTLRKKEKISIKQGNYILALVIDIILGYYILEILFYDRKEIGVLLLGILEKLVNSMYSLLKWLMGAPAGLKLNNAFNKMLGKYFSYHVELWWLFLDVSSERLDLILHIYQYLGYFGLTFQAAIISDMLCVTTFHSYCIYVYAARLFNIQISGLTAMLRLFVGRKYNPLRNCIDSCEYTNQELFVGTVAFTILLLLLPTTLMYYIVFTMFRVLTILAQYVLARLIHFVQTLPLYVIMLWITRSPKLAGEIYIEEQESIESHLMLKIKLFNKPLKKLMNYFKTPVEIPKDVEWTNIISSVFTGKQII
ncbi:phosphatidylinositol N-acetylglucosaminyltransferase subunit Q isoform X1 [Pieris brassicae]|uniref:phosphatidylinositol N-acetylglucosaminyltransferase subunit Q isoform X1 n=1 Tax=Pieris brassicae TaxID=7116 RepID=UPI001E660945|nr:phosphatidylinositol N-acetylglucosaminyltransferase subunit Q isoform X1 [Pieris brassicae]